MWRLALAVGAAEPEPDPVVGSIVGFGSAGIGIGTGLVAGYVGMHVSRLCRAEPEPGDDHGSCHPLGYGAAGYLLGHALAQPISAGLLARHLGHEPGPVYAASLVTFGVGAAVFLGSALPGTASTGGLTTGTLLMLFGPPVAGGIAAAYAPRLEAPVALLPAVGSESLGLQLIGAF
jgi:hypothetical protein